MKLHKNVCQDWKRGRTTPVVHLPCTVGTVHDGDICNLLLHQGTFSTYFIISNFRESQVVKFSSM